MIFFSFLKCWAMGTSAESCALATVIRLNCFVPTWIRLIFREQIFYFGYCFYHFEYSCWVVNGRFCGHVVQKFAQSFKYSSLNYFWTILFLNKYSTPLLLNAETKDCKILSIPEAKIKWCEEKIQKEIFLLLSRYINKQKNK